MAGPGFESGPSLLQPELRTGSVESGTVLGQLGNRRKNWFASHFGEYVPSHICGKDCHYPPELQTDFYLKIIWWFSALPYSYGFPDWNAQSLHLVVAKLLYSILHFEETFYYWVSNTSYEEYPRLLMKCWKRNLFLMFGRKIPESNDFKIVAITLLKISNCQSSFMSSIVF